MEQYRKKNLFTKEFLCLFSEIEFMNLVMEKNVSRKKNAQQNKIEKSATRQKFQKCFMMSDALWFLLNTLPKKSHIQAMDAN